MKTLKTACATVLMAVLLCLPGMAQRPHVKKLAKLDKTILETSGLVWCNDTLFTHNDSGGEPCLYGINLDDGSVAGLRCFNNMRNTDWEDVTADDTYLYVGDIGNNSGTRRPLVIYRVAKADVGKPGAQIDSIAFSFADQTDFVPMFRRTAYDCEALFVAGDWLMVFTKDWKDKRSRLYRIPKTPGNYSLQPCLELDVRGLITGADFNRELNVLAVIGYEKNFPFNPLLYFIGLNPDYTAIVNYARIELPLKNKQTEGIVWENNNSLLISNEYLIKVPARMHRIALDHYRLMSLMRDPHPDPEKLIETEYNYRLVLSDAAGNKVFEGSLREFLRKENEWINMQRPALVSWKLKHADGWFVWE